VRLGEWLSVGWLTPAMDRLFAEGAGARRRFLDRLVLALEPGHARNAARLEGALRERNRLLAEPAEPDPAWLDGIEAQLAEAGTLVATARARLVEQLSVALAGLPESPFARPELAYVPGGPLAATAPRSVA
jgi:DNA replication and repair protein RecF